MTTSIVMDKARGVIDFPINIDSAHFDSHRKEYVICFSETFNGKTEPLAITISDTIILNDGDHRGSIHQRTIKDETKSHWWGFEDRKDLLVYGLKTQVVEGCKTNSSAAANIPIINTSNEGTEAFQLIKFKGNLIQEMLEKKSPFVIFSSRFYPSDVSNQKFSPCVIKGVEDHSCIMLFIKPLSHKSSQGDDEYYKLLSIEELTYSKYANALWYLALPFSVPIDASIDLLIVFILLSIFGRPPV